MRQVLFLSPGLRAALQFCPIWAWGQFSTIEERVLVIATSRRRNNSLPPLAARSGCVSGPAFIQDFPLFADCPNTVEWDGFIELAKQTFLTRYCRLLIAQKEVSWYLTRPVQKASQLLNSKLFFGHGTGCGWIICRNFRRHGYAATCAAWFVGPSA
ncbi:hypothetical protein F2981_00430 [Sinorhizobium meliloti]|nr:hypothetical protein [Sinorhizobium meliloti]